MTYHAENVQCDLFNTWESCTLPSRDLRRVDAAPEPTLFAPHTRFVPWSGRLRRGKLRAPLLSDGAVPRPRVLQRIDALDRPLTLIVAPAGFGKTTVAAQWAAAHPPTAWLTLDERDQSFQRFWAHLSAALESVAPADFALGELVTAALALPHRAPPVELGRMLADELLDVPEPLRLVLDDFHHAATREVCGFLAGLLDIAPPSLRLLVTSRFEPEVSLNRLRMRELVTEVRSLDLLFTEDETHTLVVRTFPGSAQVAMGTFAGSLQERTRGWPAGVRLAALAGPYVTPAAGGHDTAGPDRAQMAWMLDETLAGLPAETRVVLLYAALPDGFNRRLLRALAPAATPPQVLNDAIDFAVRSDLCRHSARHDGDWFEFPALPRDALRYQLERDVEPDAVRALHERAADWFAAAGAIDMALAHRVAAGDVAAAAALVEREAPPAFSREDWPAVARWLALLPDDVVHAHPRLLLAQAWLEHVRGQFGPLPALLRTIEERLAQGGCDAAESEAIRAEVAALTVAGASPFAADPAVLAEQARAAARHIDPAQRYGIGVAWFYYGVGLQVMGRHDDAVRELRAWTDAAGSHFDAGSIRGLLGLLFVDGQAGHLAQVASTARAVIDITTAHQLRLTSGWGHRFLGDVLYEWNDLDGAAEHYGAVARDHEFFHLTGVREALFGLALTYYAAGRRDEAWRALDRARELVVAAGVLEHLPAIDSYEAFLAFRGGDLSRAASWAAGNRPELDSASLHVMIHPAVVRAAILCASPQARDVEEAVMRLAELRRRALAAHFHGPAVRIDALRAIALLRRGDRAAALAAMESSLRVGLPNGYLRSYLDLFPLFQEELRELATVGLPPAVQAALNSEVTAAVPAALEPLAHLTEREQEVLSSLVQRLSYREISDQLFISPHTVKRHVSSIYSKLGVPRRLDAIHAAETVGRRP